MVKHIHLRSLVSGICAGQEVFWGSQQEGGGIFCHLLNLFYLLPSGS